METIEERATKKAMKMLSPNAHPTTKELLIEIATEQRRIEIDKACNVFCKICGYRKDICKQGWRCLAYEEFENGMEEQE